MPAPRVAPSDIAIKRAFTVAIKKRMAEDKISISTVAERMGTGRTSVRRILDANNTAITFRSVSRIAQAVGLKFRLVAEPMSPKELGRLAHRLAKSKTRAERAQLTKKITRGFYAGS